MADELNDMLNSTAKELESLLNTKTVVGEPVELENYKIIPLISVGFGFGMGGGSGEGPKREKGGARGIGCGGGVRPVAVLILGPDGMRVESIKSGAASAVENVAQTIGKVVGEKMNTAAE